MLGYARIRFPHVSFNIGAALTQPIFEINGASRRLLEETTMSIRKRRASSPQVEQVAGNGLLNRRALLRGGAVVAGAMTSSGALTGAAAEPLQNDPWSLERGLVVPAYQVPSRFEKDVVRTLSNPNNEFRNSHARTPHQLLQGAITPNGLFFSICHSALPDIDPAQHKLVIHGLVKQPLVYTLDSLSRYPMVTRTHFLECSGNSAPMFSSEPLQVTAQAIHGLVSNAEWTGVLLSTLLEETGIDPKATWLLAEGADAPSLHRSVPIKKALDDAMIALYQNGERIQPGNGYPMRLLLPGYQGNMNVKYVRRIKLIDQPAMSFFESKTYSQILPTGKMWLFHFTQEVKSFITHPSFGHALQGPGFYEISGVAYSGNGRISKVMVSADGGKSWAQAALQEPVMPKAFVRFRMPWRWDGQPAVLQSRAFDEAGNVQPTRAEFVAARGQTDKPLTTPLAFPNQHYNSITSWGIDSKGEIKHVYA